MCNQLLTRTVLIPITQAMQDCMAWVITDTAILLASNDSAQNFMHHVSCSYRGIFKQWESRLHSLAYHKVYYACAEQLISSNAPEKTWFTVCKFSDTDGVFYWIRAVNQAYSKNTAIQPDILKNIINHLPHFIFWKNARSEFLGCNQTFANMLGLNHPDEIIGKNDYELPWLTKQAAQYRHDDFEIMSTKRPKLFYEEKQHDREGNERIVLVSKIPLLNEQKPILANGIACIYQDITEMKRLEQMLMNSIKHAEEASRKKSEFIANMSHDLRTPITGILGLAEYIKDQAQQEETQEYADYIIRSTQALLTRLNDIIDWIENDENLDKKIQAEIFQLDQIIWQNIILLNPAIKLKGLSIYYEENNFNTQTLFGRKIAIDRIILNLLSLSVRLADEGEINIKTRLLNESENKITTDQFLEINIADQRSENHDDYNTPSNKINLRWVEHYVCDLGGDFFIDHNNSNGMHHYTIKIPLDPPHAASKKLALFRDVKNISLKKKILVIDTSQLACLGHQRILEQFFNEVQTQVITDLNLDGISQHPFDIAFIGQSSEHIGLTNALIEKLKEKNPKIKIVALGHHGSAPTQFSAHTEEKFTAVLPKPLSSPKVQQFVGQFI
jgi:PAS domain S-box-containing protein